MRAFRDDGRSVPGASDAYGSDRHGRRIDCGRRRSGETGTDRPRGRSVGRAGGTAAEDRREKMKTFMHTIYKIYFIFCFIFLIKLINMLCFCIKLFFT